MAEREAHLQIDIAAAGAVASARLIQDALQAIALQAEKTQEKLDALAKAKAPVFRAPPASAPSAPRSAPTTAAPPRNIPANPQIGRLKSEVDGLNATLSKMAAPKISVGGISREVTSVAREIDKLAAKDLSRLGDNGAAAIKKIQDRVGQLNQQIAEVGKESIRASNLKAENFIGPRTSSQARSAERLRESEAARRPDTSPMFVGPVLPQTSQTQNAALQQEQAKRLAATSEGNLRNVQAAYQNLGRTLAGIKAPDLNTRALQREIGAVGRDLEKLSKADLSRIADGGISAVAKLQNRVGRLAGDIDKLRDAARKANELSANLKAENFIGPRTVSQASSSSRKADRERQSMTPAASSASFVGPMPETRYQAAQRVDRDKEASYDAGAAIKKMAQNLSPKVNIDTGGAIKQVEGLRNAFAKVGDAAMSMQGVIAGAGVMVLGRDIARTGMAFESLQKGLETATGSSAQAKIEMERLRTESNRLGIDILHTGREYVNFSAAIQGSNVNMDKAKDTFFAVAQAMALLGRSPEGAARAFKALEQFASKGQIMSEELKGQLAEQLPGAFNITAKALGMTAEELGRAMEEGRVSAQSFFDVFGDAVKGKFPVEGQIESASASFARFNNALLEIKNTIANGGFLKALADGADEMAKFMRSDVGKEMAKDLGGALKSAIDSLIGTFKFLVENVETVKTVLGTLIALRVATWAFEFGKAVAELGVQFFLLSKYLIGHPLLGLAAVALSGAAALYALSKSTVSAEKAQQKHNDALRQLKDLQSKIKTTPSDDKDRINNLKAEIGLIRDAAREEKQRLDDNIKKLKEVQKIREAMSATGLGAEFGGMAPGSAQDDEDLKRQQRERQMAQQREMMARRAMLTSQTGFTGGFTGAGTGATAPGVVATAQAETLAKATAEIEKQIAAQEKLFQAFEMNAGAAAELKSQMEMAAQIKRDFEGKVSAEGFQQIVDLMDRLAEAKDKVAAGPIIQELNTSILDLYKLADAHGKGVDAANAERVAQEARNRVVEAGIGISSQAAQAIFTLSDAQREAALTAEMAQRTAELQRTASVATATTSALINTSGNKRIETVAQIQEAANLGVDPTDKRPTKENAIRQAPILEAGKTAVVESREGLKQEVFNVDLEVKAMEKIAALERGRTVEKARQAGEERALLQLQKGVGGSVGLGNVSRKDLDADQKKFVEAQGRIAAAQFRIQQGNRTGTTRTPVDHFGEKLRELQESIAGQQQLAAAYGKGTEAVEQQTRAQEIMNQVHGLSEKLTKQQKAKLEELIGTLYDAKTAAAFEGAKMDLKNEIDQIQKMAEAEYQSAEAANAEAVAQEARQKAIELGIVSDRNAVRALEELIGARQRAQQAGVVNSEIRDNRSEIQALEDEAAALKKVGDERFRAMAESETRRKLKDQGIPENTPRFQEAISTAGDVAVKDFTQSQEQSIESGRRQITSIGQQTEALGLLGEAYVRRQAELQMEAQLIEETGTATGDLAQQQIQLAGDIAVATDRMNRQNDALRQLADSGLTFNEQMRSISADGLGHMEDALVDIITGTKSVKEAFADMAKSIAADLARMAIRQAITIPLAMGLNSMFGGMGAAAAAPVFGGFASAASVGNINWLPTAHTGGVMGQDSLRMAPVDPAVFTGAPRFHSGKMPTAMPSTMPKLGGGEMAAILKKDEGVFTPGQMAALGPAGGSQTVVVSPTINVTQPQGATEQQGASFGKAIGREITAMVDERIQRAFRPGGVRNQSGMGY
jgi:tape measure domain-containing protein